MDNLNLQSVKIGSLWNEGRGANFKSEFSSELNLAPDLKITAPLNGELQVIRMKDGVTALLSNLNTTAEVQCVRCLENFEFPIQITSTERQFFEENPGYDFDTMESFLIDRHELSINLKEPLRQEIILQFPINPLCSERCLGLCPVCHQNLNQLTGDHPCELPDLQENSQPIQKPFANLKELLN